MYSSLDLVPLLTCPLPLPDALLISRAGWRPRYGVHAARGARLPSVGRTRRSRGARPGDRRVESRCSRQPRATSARDRKSTRLQSSHLVISYAVFCNNNISVTHVLTI